MAEKVAVDEQEERQWRRWNKWTAVKPSSRWRRKETAAEKTEAEQRSRWKQKGIAAAWTECEVEADKGVAFAAAS